MIDLGLLKGSRIAVIVLGKFGQPRPWPPRGRGGRRRLLGRLRPAGPRQGGTGSACPLRDFGSEGVGRVRTGAVLSPASRGRHPAPHPIGAGRPRRRGVPLISGHSTCWPRPAPTARYLVASNGTNGKVDPRPRADRPCSWPRAGRTRIQAGGNLGPAGPVRWRPPRRGRLVTCMEVQLLPQPGDDLAGRLVGRRVPQHLPPTIWTAMPTWRAMSRPRRGCSRGWRPTRPAVVGATTRIRLRWPMRWWGARR